jgi:thiosulfate reductase cytochrome b subunit
MFVKEGSKLELSRRFGIAIVCGIPAIVGSGLFWALSKSWIVVFAYLFLLVATLLVFVVSPRLFTNHSQIWDPTVGKVKGLVAKLQTRFTSA